MKIFLNNTAVDTFPDASPVAVTYALAPIGDVSARFANVTTSFTLPLSDFNREILGLSDTVQGTDTTPYAPLDCTIEQGGARVLDAGKAVIERITPEGIELSAYSGLFSFFDAIKEARLQDLDLSDLSHNWDLTDVATLVDPSALTTGVTWAISDLGAVTSGTIDIQFQRPSVTLAELCTRIATGQGYALAGDFWTSLPYTIAGILLMESDEQRRRDFREARNFVYSRDSRDLTTTFEDTAIPQTESWQVDLPISQDPGEIWTGDAYAETTTNSVTDFKVELEWYGYSDNDTIAPEYSQYDFTTELIHIDAALSETVLDSNVSAVTFAHTASLEALAVSVDKGEKVIVRVSMSCAPPSPAIGFDLLVQFGLRGEIKTSNATGNFSIGSAISPGDMLPDMTQREFLLMVARLFGLILVADDKAGTLTAYKYEDILSDTANAVDWSGKLIPEAGTIYASKRTRADKYGQRSYLRFENDELSPDLDYGRTWLTVPDTTLDREKVIAEIPLAASGSVTTVSIPIPLLSADLYEDDGAGSYIETEKDFIDRITLIYDDYPGNAGITLQEGSGGPTTAITAGNYLACIPVTDLSGATNYGAHFDRHLSRDGYAALQTVLENYQELECNFMLTPADIVALDLTKLVYLRQFGAYFYIEKVANYVYEQPTKVTLVKVKP